MKRLSDHDHDPSIHQCWLWRDLTGPDCFLLELPSKGASGCSMQQYSAVGRIGFYDGVDERLD
jgi:hypothetical protein